MVSLIQIYDPFYCPSRLRNKPTNPYCLNSVTSKWKSCCFGCNRKWKANTTRTFANTLSYVCMDITRPTVHSFPIGLPPCPSSSIRQHQRYPKHPSACLNCLAIFVCIKSFYVSPRKLCARCALINLYNILDRQCERDRKIWISKLPFRHQPTHTHTHVRAFFAAPRVRAWSPSLRKENFADIRRQYIYIYHSPSQSGLRPVFGRWGHGVLVAGRL